MVLKKHMCGFWQVCSKIFWHQLICKSEIDYTSVYILIYFGCVYKVDG